MGFGAKMVFHTEQKQNLGNVNGKIICKKVEAKKKFYWNETI